MLAGAVYIVEAESVSITSGCDFLGNEVGETGGMYDCDDHNNNTHFENWNNEWTADLSLLLLVVLSCMYICVVVIGALFIAGVAASTITDNTFGFNFAGDSDGAAVFVNSPITNSNPNVFKKNIPDDIVSPDYWGVS